jgi:ankyrin repeat protein
MFWSQDVLVCVLFPYLLPSLPFAKPDCWSVNDFRPVLEYLLVSLSNISPEMIQSVLETFVNQMFSISSCHKMSLDSDLCFLAEIEKRCHFENVYHWKSSSHSHFASSFLIENQNQQNLNTIYKPTLSVLCHRGHKETVALLLKHKIDVHIEGALLKASYDGHKEIVALLLEHKADIHAQDDLAFQTAVLKNRKDTVDLLLEHKANIGMRVLPTFAHVQQHRYNNNGNPPSVVGVNHSIVNKRNAVFTIIVASLPFIWMLLN